MRLKFSLPMAILVAVGSIALANSDNGNNLTLSAAIELHKSGMPVDNSVAVKLVKQDIKACLTYYSTKECDGPAKIWLDNWENLEFPLPSEDNANSRKLFTLSSPPKRRFGIPYANSSADYFFRMPSPFVSSVNGFSSF